MVKKILLFYNYKIMNFKFINQKIYKFIIFLIVIFSLFLSIYFNSFNYDFHHPQIMFVDANKLLDGFTPYKDIFIIYGILTTLIHSLSIVVFGNNILSIFIITAIFYSFTFLILFLILKNLQIDEKTAILGVSTVFLVHPSIVLPWSDYFSYFFLLLGIFYFTKKESLKNFILFGFFWSLAYLCRQTVFVPLFLSLLYFFFSELFFEFKTKNFFLKSKFFILVLLIFFIPITLFLLYLKYLNIFIYWKLATFNVADTFIPYDKFNTYAYLYSFYELFRPLMSNLIYSIKNLDPRFFFYFIIFFSNILILFITKNINSKISKLSFLSLSLSSSSFHLVEIFRLSTGLVIGLIPLTFFFKKKIIFFFLGMISLLLPTWYGGKHNYIYDYYYRNRNNLTNTNVDYFKFQIMPKTHADFYEKFQASIQKINSTFVLRYNYNYTSVPILAYMSGTKSFQVGTVYTKRFNKIYLEREVIDLKKNFFTYANEVIIFVASGSEKIDEKFSDNFYLYEKIDYPFNGKTNLLILLPKKTIRRLNHQ